MPPGDVSDIETEEAQPTLEELQAAMKQQSEQFAELKKNHDLALQALAEKDTRASKPEKEEGEEEPEELDPATAKALQKLQAQHATQLNAVQDQFDEMSFLQYAASAGLDPAIVAETAKQYADYRAAGVRVKGRDGQERPMTRADVLYQVVGKNEIANTFKTAPEKNLAALKAKLVGGAGFEGVGAAPEGQRYVRLDSEIDKLPVKEKAGKLEKALTGIEF